MKNYCLIINCFYTKKRPKSIFLGAWIAVSPAFLFQPNVPEFSYHLMTRTMPIEWMLKNNIFIASSNWYVQQPTKWLMIANHYRYSQCIFDYGSFKFSFNETSTAYITFSWTLHFFDFLNQHYKHNC